MDHLRPTPKYNTENDLREMVDAHYNDRTLMYLRGEIHFDPELSAAEVDAAENGIREVTGRGIEGPVYLPCAGTLRHIPSLLGRGITDLRAVDLSKGSLDEGVAHFKLGGNPSVKVYNADIRATDLFKPARGFRSGVFLGNSLGDVTDPQGHLDFIKALGDAMAEGGAMAFDYVGNRYNPAPGETVTSRWDDALALPGEEVIPVFDTRSRTFTPSETGDGTGILSFTCKVETPEGELIVPEHGYTKLIVPDELLVEQFAQAGMDLHVLGPIAQFSEYHQNRINTSDDLGMMGRPNNLYVAIKR